ncbi:MAG TPA: acyl-CoA dehydrogenase family protein [Acidimicrobiia bacterium]|nr:acyl-CoA dehydrogenase family protein [Acidimicrobiia bacterium]
MADSRLPDDMLARFAERAPAYDRENSFFSDDFEELRQAGYLTMAVPADLGGAGMTLEEVMQEQRRLAYHAPADAVAVNMHLYWTGVAADLLRAGDESLVWLLEEAAAGEVFAAGHAERGNDLPLLFSSTKAERADGGWRFTGHKSFGTMTPVWTRLGLHGQDDSDPTNPKVVHAFLARDAEGVTVKETWDSLGMRATRSDDTVLDGAFVPDERVARVAPAGFAGMDLFTLAIFGWGEIGFSNVYYAIAQRAVDLTVEFLREKTSVAIPRGRYAYHPEYQHGLAEMFVELDGLGPQLDTLAHAWSTTIADAATWPAEAAGMWGLHLVGLKHRTTNAAFRIVDRAVELAGGFGVNRKSEIERLFRDARMGRIHPANFALVSELTAKGLLGLDLDDPQRWG